MCAPLLFVPHEIGRLLDSESTVRFALNDESAGIRSTLSDYTPGRVILRCSPSVKGIGHLSHQRDMTEARFDRSCERQAPVSIRHKLVRKFAFVCG